MFTVYYFHYENSYYKSLALELRDSTDLKDYEKYLDLTGDLREEPFDFKIEAQRFAEKLPPNCEFFCIGDNESRYIEQSLYCEKMTKEYLPFKWMSDYVHYVNTRRENLWKMGLGRNTNPN